MENQLLGLYRLSSELAIARSFEDVYQICSSVLGDVMHFDAFELLMKRGNELTVAAKVGLYEPSSPLLLDGEKGITVACAREKKTIYVPDVTTDERYVEAAPGIQSEVAVPVTYEDELMGVINVEKREKNGFTHHDIALLETFSHMLARALKNVEFKKQVEESERKYRSLVEHLNVGIYRNTPGEKGSFIEVNQALVRMFGYENKEELLELPVSSLYQNPEERKRINEKLLRNGFVKNEEIRLHKKDGTPIWCSVTAVAVKADDGTVAYYDGIIEDITERKHLEEQYRDIFENAVMGIYQSTPEGRHIVVNPALAEIYGYDSPEKLIEEMDDIATQLYVDPQRREELLRQLTEHGEVSHFESEVYKKDGSTIWICENARAVRDPDGTILYLVGTVENITARKRVEEALKKSEEQYRQLFEEMKDALYISTVDGKFIDVNQSMVDLLGYRTKEEVFSLDIEKDFYYDPEQRAEILRMMQRYGYIKDFEVHIKGKNGEKRIALETSRARKDESGRIVGYEGIIRDITEKKYMEEALKHSEKKYRSIFENVSEGIYRLDAEKRIQDANKALLDFFGYTLEELKSINPSKLYKDPEKRKQFMEELMKKGSVRDYEIEYVRKDGSIAVGHEYAVVVKERDTPYIDGVIHDITQLKEVQQEVEFYNALLRHDVANKLQLIMGHLDILLEEPLNEEQRDMVSSAMRSALTALKIIENVRKLRVLQAGEAKEHIDIDGVIREILEEYGKTAQEKHITMTYEPWGKKIVATDSLREALSNIIRNALIHSGGTFIHISVEESDGYAVIRIEDDGVGVDDRMKEKIFDAGYRGKESTGSGLGLYLSRKIVESMGGRITLTDGKNKKGSVFTLSIPQ